MAHLVFVTKYRRPVISENIWGSLCYGFNLASKRLSLGIVELNYERDHVHLIVEYSPKLSVSEIVNSLKGTSSIVARRDCVEELKCKLYGDAFWTPSYFASSCGGATIGVLKGYVQAQNKAALKGGVSTQRF